MSGEIQKVKIKDLPKVTSISDEDVFVVSDGLETYKVSSLDISKYISDGGEFADKYIPKTAMGVANGVTPLNSNKKIDGKYITYGTISNTAYEGNAGKTLETNLDNHILDDSNPHKVTKSQVGLSNVENKSSSTIRGEITLTNVTNALGYTPINSNLKGANSGIAELDSNGKVPSSQLPSYVDDVVEFDDKSSFPTTGETSKIYIDTSKNLTYRWSGSAYVEISTSLALGETSSTAFRGDRGKTAYEHSQSTHARTDATKVESSTTNGNIKINGTETTVYTHPSGTNPHGTTKSDVGLGNVGNFKAVSTVASQGLTDTEKSNARTNIGAGTSSFSGSYNDLSNKPTIPTNTNQLTNGAGFITSSGTAKTISDTLPLSKGGTGQTTGIDAANALINSLGTGDTAPTDDTNIVVQGVGDYSNKFYRKPVSLLWNYIKSKLATVATSGSYNDLTDKPTIPSAVTESTVSGWGFTKNTGTYSKPSTGIPKTDLANAVQTSLGKADTALQSHQDISGKENSSNKVTSWSSTTTDAHYPSEKLVKSALDGKANSSHTHTKSQISDFPSSMPASDVYSWAKASTKPSYTKSEVGLGNVGNFKAVSTVASQGLTDTEKANARANIGAGTSSFSGSYNDLTDKPTIPSAVTESTVSGWGFTKNTGTYSKPSTGIPKTDLANAVQTSLGKADTALQSHQDISGKANTSGTYDNLNSGTTKKIQTYKQGSTTETYGTQYPVYAQWRDGSHVRFKCDNYTTEIDYADNAGTVNGLTVQTAVPANAVFTDTNTWRPLGTGATDACAGNDSRLSDSRTPKAHTHTKSQITDFPTSLPANGGTATNVSGTVAIENGGTGATTASEARTNLGLSNKTAASGGTAVSLVTTGEKYTWNNKMDKTTVLTGGSQTSSSSADGGSNVYTFTKSDGTTSTLTVKNGSKGSQGSPGTTPTIKAASGTNIGTVGTPSVTASTSGTETTFTFNYLKGAKGDKGDPGQNATTTSVVSTSANGLAPKVTDTSKFLKGDGTWATPTNTTYSDATQSVHGLMSADDKTKLDGIATGANKYTHPSYTAKSSGLYKVTVDATGHVSAATAVAKADITGLGIPAQDTTYSAFVKSGSGAKAGLVPAPSTTAGTTKYLREDGTWATPSSGTDTKNTAGSTDTSSKIFLVGATSQAANPQTYSHDTAYVGTDGCLYSNSTRVVSEVFSSTEPTTQKTGDYWCQDYE